MYNLFLFLAGALERCFSGRVFVQNKFCLLIIGKSQERVQISSYYL